MWTAYYESFGYPNFQNIYLSKAIPYYDYVFYIPGSPTRCSLMILLHQDHANYLANSIFSIKICSDH